MKKKVFLIACVFCVLISLVSFSSSNFDYDKFYFKEVEGGYQMSQSYRLIDKFEGVLPILETYQDVPIVEASSLGTSLPVSNVEDINGFSKTTNDANNVQYPKEFIIGLIIALSILGVILASLCIISIIEYQKCKIVLQNSERIKRLLELNKTVNFRKIQSVYSNQQACNSKHQLDNLSLDDYLIGLITSNESYYRNIIESVLFNRNKYYSYTKQAESIRTTATEEFCIEHGFSLKKFTKYENRIFQWKKLRKPQLNVTVYCKVTYTSPQGRNHYWKDKSYDFDQLKSLFDRTIELKSKRQTRQYQIKVERAKMTDSLRYDILKRDNFRCQICGSCASDGVKLHVDHIYPVAKGGQTVPSNLRTLCDRCNIGKSDKV